MYNVLKLLNKSKEFWNILYTFIWFREKNVYISFNIFVTYSTQTIMAIDDKAFDKRFFSAYVGRKLGVIREEKQMTLAELATKTGASYHGNITNIINWRVSASIEQLWKMAEALGLSQKEFDNLVLEAKEAEIEHSHGVRVKTDTCDEEISEEYALKSLIGNNPAAQEEAKSVIRWIKQKYGLK